MNTNITIGQHRKYITCRFCFSDKVKIVIDLGDMPLAGGFFKKGTSQNQIDQEKLFPLQINFCSNCYLLQVNTAIDADILFKDYFYFSSTIKTLVEHFEKKAQELKELIPNSNEKLIVEIGCNDGAFIRSLISHGFKALGVDPATNVVEPLIKKGLPIINDYFTLNTAKIISKSHGKADAIYGFHSMAHIEDMHDVVKGVKHLLKPDGFLAFEVHYLGDLIEEMQYDMIYHEHQFYYSLLSLKNFFATYDMEIFDVKHVPIRAGSMMYYVQHKKTGKRKISKTVKEYIRKEKIQGLHIRETYELFAKKIQKTRQQLVSELKRLTSENKTIVGYGASGRGTIIMNYCRLDNTVMDYVIDDAPAKHGAITPGIHHTIHPSSILTGKNRPDYAVLFAWPFVEEIVKKHQDYLKKGGKFIVPLPKVKLIDK